MSSELLDTMVAQPASKSPAAAVTAHAAIFMYNTHA
jgi:hypothetical protein